MKINRAFIKGTNWALAGLLSILGFTGCEITGPDEYGTPNADYTVKGSVVNKADGKPIEGIRVGYDPTAMVVPMYGVPPAPYTPKASVTTDAKGEFKLNNRFYGGEFYYDENNVLVCPIYVDDIDGEKNGLFQSEVLQVNFKDAEHSGKPKSWYEGEYTKTIKVELTEIKGE